MGAPLNDITIYYNGQVIKDAPDDLDFRKTVNYIADFYHDRLNGYKPPKTGRICIHLGPSKNWDKPSYFGAICSYDNVIDEQKYLSFSKKEKYKYILDLLHSTVSEIASIYNWEQAIFNEAYNHIIESGFKFEKFYPEKKSKDRKHTGQIILTKTEEKSTLNTIVTSGELVRKEQLLEKTNWYWYDNIYNSAQSCKWFDNTSFGLYKGEKNCYFSIDENKTINDLIGDTDNLFKTN
jgi:hypothetical protein